MFPVISEQDLSGLKINSSPPRHGRMDCFRGKEGGWKEN